VEKIVIADCVGQLKPSKDALPQSERRPPIDSWFLDSVVEKNIEKTIASILQWIEDLGNAGYGKSTIRDFFCFRLGGKWISTWEFSRLEEKNIYDDAAFWSLIRIRALEIERARFPALQMVYAGSDPFLRRSFNKPGKDISQNLTSLNSDCEKAKQADHLPIIKVVVASLRILLEEYFWSLQERLKSIFRDTSVAVREDVSPVVSIVTYANSSEIWMDEKENVESVYWGPLPGLLRQQGYRISWVVFNSDLSRPGRIKLRNFMKTVSDKNGDQIHLIEDSLDFSTMIRLARIFFSLIYRVVKISKDSRLRKNFILGESNTNVFPLFMNTWVFSMVSPRAIRNIIKAACFPRYFKNAAESSFALYMSEGQGWEKGLVAGWRAGQKGSIFGVKHSLSGIADLRHYNVVNPRSTLTEKNARLPDKIICISEERLTHMSRFGIPNENLCLAEALRYIGVSRLSTNAPPHEISKKTIFLVIGDVSRSVNERMFKMVAAAKDAGVLGTNETIVFRPHPNAEDCTPILRKLQLQELVCWSKVELIASLHEAKTVFCSTSTSTIFEIGLLGIPVIVFRNKEKSLLCPLYSSLDSTMMVDSDADFVEKVVSSVPIKTISGYIPLDSQLPRWRRFLDQQMLNAN
jgi:surface carbohydrate biosynthesis protein (TIGR04326 family)